MTLSKESAVLKQRAGRKKQGGHYTSLRYQSVDGQAKIAIVLLSLIPVLTCIYLGEMAGTDGREQMPLPALLTVLACAGTVAAAGYLILRKYVRSILKLRYYVNDIANGILPEAVHLDRAGTSDDLQCIEEGLNLILKEMQQRLELIEEKLQVESYLREALQQQQNIVLKTERRRVMLQSVGAACHHLGQPATALRMRLYLMREKAGSGQEMDEIDDSIRDVEAIESVLIKLRDVHEYRTEPYLESSDSAGNHILAI